MRPRLLACHAPVHVVCSWPEPRPSSVGIYDVLWCNKRWLAEGESPNQIDIFLGWSTMQDSTCWLSSTWPGTLWTLDRPVVYKSTLGTGDAAQTDLRYQYILLWVATVWVLTGQSVDIGDGNAKIPCLLCRVMFLVWKVLPVVKKWAIQLNKGTPYWWRLFGFPLTTVHYHLYAIQWFIWLGLGSGWAGITTV